MKTCAVSIDLDPIGHYYAIHGLCDPPPDTACTSGLERFLELARRAPFKATLFVVASELKRSDFAALIRQAAAEGHEIANHTLSHRYDLTRMPQSGIEEEIAKAHSIIAEAAGKPPRGFRAPGYNVSPGVIDTLVKLGYLYDSSVFPSWPYYLAKALIMGMGRLSGRESRAINGPVSSMLAPTKPYSPCEGNPYSRGAAAIRELPISLVPFLRLPLIGTSFVLAGPIMSGFLHAAAGALRFFNFELHGIDFIGCDEAGPGLLKARQPDARIELAVKLARIESLFSRLKGRRFVTLSEAALEL